MKRNIPAFAALALWGCVGREAEPERPNPRPFQVICDRLMEYPQPLRKAFVSELAKGLMSESEAGFHRACSAREHPVPPIPNWVDLVRELLGRSERALLLDLLREKAIDYAQYEELAEILAVLRDPELFSILMSHSEPIDQMPDDLNDARSLYQRSAVGVLEHYLGGAPEEDVAVKRLVDILERTYWATARGWAALALGSSDRPEAIDALSRALQDRGSVHTPNGRPGETVANWAERALKKIEKRTGRPIPRVAP